MGYYETSAKKGTNVNRAFEALIDSIHWLFYFGYVFVAIYKQLEPDNKDTFATAPLSDKT